MTFGPVARKAVAVADGTADPPPDPAFNKFNDVNFNTKLNAPPPVDERDFPSSGVS